MFATCIPVGSNVSLETTFFYQNTIKHVYITMFIHIGSLGYEKPKNVLTKKRLVKAIKQASSVALTSCLEEYHSVVNHFAPKMTDAYHVN